MICSETGWRYKGTSFQEHIHPMKTPSNILSTCAPLLYTPGYWQYGKVLGLGSTVDTVFLEDLIFTYGAKKHII